MTDELKSYRPSVPFAWIERHEVLTVWLIIAATVLTLSWMGLLQ